MKIGDRVRKRGFEHVGTIFEMLNDDKWASVDWDKGNLPVERPRTCHVKELDLV